MSIVRMFYLLNPFVLYVSGVTGTIVRQPQGNPANNILQLSTPARSWVFGGSSDSTNAYKAYNNNLSSLDRWLTSGVYNITTGAYEGKARTIIDGTEVYGEYVSMYLPNNTQFTEFRLKAATSVADVNKFPKKFRVAGSLDNTNFTELCSAQNVSFPGANAVLSYTISSTALYRYIRVIVEESNGDAATNIVDMEFQGVEITEAETVAPSRYPSTAMSGASLSNAEGFYIATASRNGTTPHGLFTQTPSLTSTTAGTRYTTASTYDFNGNVTSSSPFTIMSDNTTIYGEWAQLVLPGYITASNMIVYPTDTGITNWYVQFVRALTIAGSSNNYEWDYITTHYFDSGPHGAIFPHIVPISQNKPYRSYRFIVESTLSNVACILNEIEIRGGSMDVVNRGFVYPPIAISAATGALYNPQLRYRCSSSISATATANTFNRAPYYGTLSGTNIVTAARYTGANGSNTVIYTMTNQGSISGDWVQLQTPTMVELRRAEIWSTPSVVTTLSNVYRDITICGGSNGIGIYNVLAVRSNLQYQGLYAPHFITLDSTGFYNTYRVIFTNTYGGTTASFGEVAFYGDTDYPTTSNGFVYPPESMTGDTTVLPDGTYISSASSVSVGNPAWWAFNNVYTNQWLCPGGRYNATTGAYQQNPPVTTTTNIGTINGEWIQLQLPTQKPMYEVVIQNSAQDADIARSPEHVTVVGSNVNLSTWQVLNNTSNIQPVGAGGDIRLSLPEVNYLYYRIIIRRLVTNIYGVSSLGLCIASEIRYYAKS